VLVVALVSVVFGGLALRTQSASGKGLLTLLLAVLLSGLISATYWLERRAIAKRGLESTGQSSVH
jgi:hypothetical protein